MNEEEKRTKLDYLLIAVGFIPYIGMTFLTVWLWMKYIGLPEIPVFNWHNFINVPALLLACSIFGSWILWWFFCKIIRFFQYSDIFM
jgi:hypothetical protein